MACLSNLYLFVFCRLFPNVGLIVELTHSSNMKFMKFDVPTLPVPMNGISNKESLRNTIKVSNEGHFHLHLVKFYVSLYGQDQATLLSSKKYS